MTANVLRANTRSTTLVKYAFLIFAYAVALWVFVGTVENLFVDKLHVQGVREDFALTSLVKMFPFPCTIAVAVAAWLLRRRWLDLRVSQLLIPAVAMALITPLVFMVVFYPSHYALHYDRFSATAWGAALRVLLVVTGLLVAQLLRLRRGSSTLSYV